MISKVIIIISSLFICFNCIFQLNIYAQAPDKFAQLEIANEINPTAMTVAPDGRIFLAEKDGKIWVVKDDVVLSEPLLEIDVDFYNERGISSILISPDFEVNPYIYIYYNVKGDFNRISRFLIYGDKAKPESQEILMDFNSLVGSVHNGGGMKFGIDGKLYIAVGDGDAPFAVQNFNNRLGKILRLNSDGSIPEDNPFYETASGLAKAIYAIGLRNPFSLDININTGQILVNDVGRSDHEEINEIFAGKYYGWPITEGYRRSEEVPQDYQDPLFSYDHSEGCAIIGAAFYQPETQKFPEVYRNKYFFGDYCNGEIKCLNTENGEVQTFISGLKRIVAITVDQQGNLYYLQRGEIDSTEVENTASFYGSLWKVVYTDSEKPNIAKHPISQTVSTSGKAIFKIVASGSSDLSYQWLKNGEIIDNAHENELVMADVSLEDDFTEYRCIVYNDHGSDTSNIAVLNVTLNTRPEVYINFPEENQKYKAGDTLFFSGYADDLEDGEIPETHFRWWIDFHHDDHTHPGMSPLDFVKEGKFVLPNTGKTEHNVWYRVYLTVRDSGGLFKTIFRDVFPYKATITISGNLLDLKVDFEGQITTLPFSFNSVVGIKHNIKALPYQIIDNEVYHFKNWNSNNTNINFQLSTPEHDSEISINYEIVPKGNGNGLKGYYYSIDLSNNKKVLNQITIDPTINFSGNNLIKSENKMSESYIIVWKGKLEPRFSEEYTFFTLSDNDVKVWFDGDLFIDGKTSNQLFESSSTKNLQANEKYDIQIEYKKNTGTGEMKLLWSSIREIKNIIPSTQLYPENLEIFEDYKQDGYVLYPVPVNNLLKLSFDSYNKENISFMIKDSLGKTVFEKSKNAEQGPNIIQIDVTHLNPGFYIFQLVQNGLIKVKSFSKN